MTNSPSLHESFSSKSIAKLNLNFSVFSINHLFRPQYERTKKLINYGHEMPTLITIIKSKFFMQICRFDKIVSP